MKKLQPRITQKTYWLSRDISETEWQNEFYEVWTEPPIDIEDRFKHAPLVAKVHLSQRKTFGLPYIRRGQCIKIKQVNDKWKKVK